MNFLARSLTFFSLIFFLSSGFAATATPVNDTVIQTKVSALFATDSSLKGLPLHVTSKKGDVFLQGQVNTNMQYERAVMLAESVHGVSNVETGSLKVKNSQQPIQDSLITAKVKGALLRDKIFTDKDIQYWPVHIETKNGVVYLAGSLKTKEQVANVIAIVKGVTGVRGVKDNMQVGVDRLYGHHHINVDDVENKNQ
jgi:hyperosmotically inducible protein